MRNSRLDCSGVQREGSCNQASSYPDLRHAIELTCACKAAQINAPVDTVIPEKMVRLVKVIKSESLAWSRETVFCERLGSPWRNGRASPVSGWSMFYLTQRIGLGMVCMDLCLVVGWHLLPGAEAQTKLFSERNFVVVENLVGRYLARSSYRGFLCTPWPGGLLLLSLSMLSVVP